MTNPRIRGRVMAEGRARGIALVSKHSFTFAHGVDPRTGRVTDPKSDIRGERVKGRVLVFPFGKGSTTGATWFLETVRRGNSPVAVLNLKSEPIIVTGSLLARLLYGVVIPVMSEFSKSLFDKIGNGDFVSVDSRKEEITIERRAA